MNAWTRLGLPRTADVAEIRRAYAKRLKAIDVENDPAAFIALRQALEWALSEAAARQNEGQYGEEESAEAGDWAYEEEYRYTPPPRPTPVTVRPAEAGPGAATAGEDGPAPVTVTPADEDLEQEDGGTRVEPGMTDGPAPVIVTPVDDGSAGPESEEGGSRVEPGMTIEGAAAPVIVTPALETGDEGSEAREENLALPEAAMTAPVIVTPAHEPAVTLDDDGLRFARLEALLFAEGGEGPDPEALADAVRAIVDHPDMHHIEHEASVQHWLADILVGSEPRSDPVLGMVVDRFSWEGKGERFDQNWLFQHVVERRRAVELIERVSLPGHRYHGAWRDLTAPGERLGLKPMGRAEDVRVFLKAIREHSPPAEDMLAAHRVALWDAKLNKQGPSIGIRTVIFGMWILFILAKCVGDIQDSNRSGQGPSAVVSTVPAILSNDPEVDLAPLVEAELGRGGYTRLRERNPDLHDRLVWHWTEARQAGSSRGEFESRIEAAIDEAVAAGLRGGHSSLQLDYWALHLDRLRWIRDHASGDGPSLCAALIGGNTRPVYLPANLISRDREISNRALLERPEREVARSQETRFTVPGELTMAALARSRLGAERFEAALLGGGTPPERCTARIALLEAALDLPAAERTEFLRDISRGL